MRLDESECWRVEATTDAPVFFRALGTLAPVNAVLVLEGSTEQRVPDFAVAHAVAPTVNVAPGTIFPASDTYHIRADQATLSALALLVEQHRIPAPAIHLHVYLVDRVLVEWYDAFAEDPIYCSRTLSEADLRLFAQHLQRPITLAPHAV